MVEHKDWLEETWEIKKTLARRYAGKPISQQLQDAHACVREEFRKRGWEYPEPAVTRPTTHQRKVT